MEQRNKVNARSAQPRQTSMELTGAESELLPRDSMVSRVRSVRHFDTMRTTRVCDVNGPRQSREREIEPHVSHLLLLFPLQRELTGGTRNKITNHRDMLRKSVA